MTHQNILSDFIEQIKQEAAAIQALGCTLDIPSYLARWLPMVYPNKGLKELVETGRRIEIHHEIFTREHLVASLCRPDLETCIHHYGNSHQCDYCFLVHGHRWDQQQYVQFRGVLGLHRISKLILALLLSGCPADSIQIFDHQPDYLTQVRRDLEGVGGPFDLVVIGGLVVAGHSMPAPLSPGFTFTGEIISGQVWTCGSRRLLLTTFPYGDLCGPVAQAMLEKEPMQLLFAGATGSLTPTLQVGDICTPQAIAASPYQFFHYLDM